MVTVVRSATVMINFRIGDVATNQPNTVLCPKCNTTMVIRTTSKAKSPAHPTTTVPISRTAGKPCRSNQLESSGSPRSQTGLSFIGF